MAIFIATNGRLAIGGTGETIDPAVQLSDHVRTLTLNHSAELLDASAWGVGVTRTRVKGLLDWSVNAEFNQDFADSTLTPHQDGEVDHVLFDLVADTATSTVAIRAVNGAIATTNPEFIGPAYLESYTPLAGGVADIATVTATFQGAGALARTTA